MFKGSHLDKQKTQLRNFLFLAFTLLSMLFLSDAVAATSIGGIAANITGSYTNIGKLMAGTAYLAGIGFAIAGIFKFKQHRDNPTQIPLGTPLAMVVIGALLVFLPSIFAPAGATIFGGSRTAGGFTGGGITGWGS